MQRTPTTTCKAVLLFSIERRPSRESRLEIAIPPWWWRGHRRLVFARSALIGRGIASMRTMACALASTLVETACPGAHGGHCRCGPTRRVCGVGRGSKGEVGGALPESRILNSSGCGPPSEGGYVACAHAHAHVSRKRRGTNFRSVRGPQKPIVTRWYGTVCVTARNVRQRRPYEREW
jgi:hypothetical protein